MSIDIKEALERVNNYISQVDSLLKKSYKEGKNEKDELYTKLENFILAIFPDGKERLANFKMSFPMAIAIFGHDETEEEKQEDYVTDLKNNRLLWNLRDSFLRRHASSYVLFSA